ncbi:MAG: 50S ribosomal protein L3 [Promethearchaeota archaeon]
MGHRKKHAPRHGSKAYYPRKRAKVMKGKIKHWPSSNETRFLGFGGFKAGMTHVAYIEKHKTSPYKDQEIFCPVTVIETPPLYIFGLRAYKRTIDGLKAVIEVWDKNIKDNKFIPRKIILPKEYDFNEKIARFEELIADNIICEVRGLFASQPHLSSVKRKKPDLMEIKIGGNDIKEIFEYGKSYLGKEVRIWDVYKPGQFIDVSAVTRGKGFQGPVKRFGVHKLQHKSRKAIRAVACIGPWHPARVMWTVPRAGQMGFHQRIEYNKQILKISEKGDEITPAGGFINYGIIKGDYIIIKGSIPGAKKRFIRFRDTMRGKITIETPEITYINLKSQQSRR